MAVRQRIRQNFPAPVLTITWRKCRGWFSDDLPVQGNALNRSAVCPKFSQSRNRLPILKAHAHKNQPIRVEYDKFKKTSICGRWRSQATGQFLPPLPDYVYVAIRECEMPRLRRFAVSRVELRNVLGRTGQTCNPPSPTVNTALSGRMSQPGQ